MPKLGSIIAYGVEIVGQCGEIDYDTANMISSIAIRHGLSAYWEGRDGQPPSTIVVGKQLTSYDSEGNRYVKPLELQKQAEEIKKDFPEEQVIHEIEQYIKDMDIKEVDVYDVDLIIIHQDA